MIRAFPISEQLEQFITFFYIFIKEDRSVHGEILLSNFQDVRSQIFCLHFGFDVDSSIVIKVTNWKF